MKTSFLNHHVRSLIICSFAFTLLFTSYALATVGGPTYIGFFKYNNADQSVYYIQNSQSGRGCPPELMRISLTTEKVDTAFSCDQGEQLQGNNYANGASQVMGEISKITSSFKDLTPISLSKNNIAIDIEFVSTKKLDSDPDWILSTLFLAKVYQNGKKIDEFEINGCNVEQPFTFEGYAVPGLEKKIVLLSSTKGDCFEGGYTVENLSVINGVNGLDKTSIGGYKSSMLPLVPSEHTLTIYERDTVLADSNNISTDLASPTSSMKIVVIVLIAILIGLFLGKIIFKRK